MLSRYFSIALTLTSTRAVLRQYPADIDLLFSYFEFIYEQPGLVSPESFPCKLKAFSATSRGIRASVIAKTFCLACQKFMLKKEHPPQVYDLILHSCVMIYINNMKPIINLQTSLGTIKLGYHP